MDSLTQITLGAAVGEATMGRKVGYKAPLWGAFFGTLPDLDVLANPFVSEVTSLALHRGLSHSFIVALVTAPILAWGVSRIHSTATTPGGDPVTWRDWTPLILVALVTHIILDSLTSYGTQVFQPLSDYRLSVPSIFIIDPMYTVPLAAGLLIGFRWNPTSSRRRQSNYIGLAISTLYLCVTLGIKAHVESVFSTSLDAQGKPHTEVFTQTTPFNVILWSGMVQDADGTWTGQYSLLDSDTNIEFQFIPTNKSLLEGHLDDPAIDVLEWFSKGYYTVSESGGQVRFHDLRFGRTDLGLQNDGRYLFTFSLKRGPSGQFVDFRQTRPPFSPDPQLLRRFVDRIQGEKAQVVEMGERASF